MRRLVPRTVRQPVAYRWALCLALLASAGGRPARGEMQVETVLWGFDGQVAPHRFVPLSIRVSNPTPTPFDGTLRLTKFVGESAAGAPHEQTVYVSPFASKWVQFYPYVKRDWERWVLTWDEGRGRSELPAPPFRTAKELEQPTIVLLSDAQDVSSRRGAVKSFPDHLFPPMVTATDGLDVVLLDHVPRWQAARRGAFLDWLARGGTLHLLRGADEQHPAFPPEMADLNAPFDRFRHGAGVVFRHQRSSGDVGAEFIGDVVRRETAQSVRRPKSATEEAKEAVQREDAYQSGDQLLFDDFAAGVFQDLKGLTLPRHNWPLLYLLSLLYVGLIFPGCYLLGRRRPELWRVYAVMLGGIGLFSLAFAVLGRRGHGEATGVQCLAVARPLADGQWDVTGWAAAFVTEGDTYRIAHRGSGGLYATVQDFERVNGVIRNGVEGSFDVDIPGYSSRPFTFRVKAAHKPLPVRVEEWNVADGALRSLVLSVGSGFPKSQTLSVISDDEDFDSLLIAGGRSPLFDSDAQGAYSTRVFRSNVLAVHGDWIYPLTRSGDRLVLEQRDGFPIENFLLVLESADYWRFSLPDVWERRRPSEQGVYSRLVPPLVARDLGLGSGRQAKTFRLPPDRVRLYVYAPLPSEFSLASEELPLQGGYVLYSMDLFEPE